MIYARVKSTFDGDELNERIKQACLPDVISHTKRLSQ